jgi:hypothetical protein
MARRKSNKRVDPLEALAALNRAISATPEHEQARRAVLVKYARLRKNGRPILCSPPRSELLSGHVSGAFKVIYDTAKNAEDAARELSALGAPPMIPYPCPRSRRGHLHLKTNKHYRFEKGKKTP